MSYLLEGEAAGCVNWQDFSNIQMPVNADEISYYTGVELKSFSDLFRLYHYIIYPHFLTGVPCVIAVKSVAQLKKQMLTLPDPLPIGCTLTAEKAIRHLDRYLIVNQLPSAINYKQPISPECNMPLDENQIKAATHYTGVATVVAPAGSGKTATIIARCILLLQRGIKPEQILTITFTKKAQMEMQQRLTDTLGSDGRKITVKTFHALAYMLIYELTGKRPDIITDRLPYIIDYTKENGIDAERLDSFISYNLNSLIAPDELQESKEDPKLIQGYKEYLEHIEQSNTYDQDYLLYRLYYLLREKSNARAKLMDYGSKQYGIGGRWLFVMVDESQDNNLAQEVLSRFLAAPWDNLYYVGDDDQILYTFRGSSVERILNIGEVYPNAQEIALQTNYRSHPAVVLHANQLIEKNIYRRKKNTKSGRGDVGDNIYPIESYEFGNPISELKWVAQRIKRLIDEGVKPSHIAILYRTNAQSDLPAKELSELGISYFVHKTGKSLFESGEAEAIINYLTFIKEPNNIDALSKILKYHSKEWQELIKSVKGSRYVVDSLRQAAIDMGEMRVVDFCNNIGIASQIEKKQNAGTCVQFIIAKFDLDRIFGSIDNSDRLGIIESIASKFNTTEEFLSWVLQVKALPKEDENSEGKVQLMTVHTSKGMEFPYVFLINFTEGHMPHIKAEDIEEERRIAYVGITRAKDYLIVTGYANKDKDLSRFMYEGSFISVKLPDLEDCIEEISYQLRDEPAKLVDILNYIYSTVCSWDEKEYPTVFEKSDALYELMEMLDSFLASSDINASFTVKLDSRLRPSEQTEENKESLAFLAVKEAQKEFVLMGQKLIDLLESKLKYKEAI